MRFKCNFCETVIPVRLYGDPVIKCGCGAVYRRQHSVEVVVEKAPK